MLNRPRRVLGAAAAVLALAILAISQLQPSSSPKLLVPGGSETAKAGAALERSFGQEPIVVSLRQDLATTLSPQVLGVLLALEGRIARLDGVRAVYGPATLLNQTIIQAEKVLDNELGGLSRKAEAAARAAGAAARRDGGSPRTVAARQEAARRAVLGPKQAEYRELFVRLGSVGLPALDNERFVRQVIFGTGVEPKERFRFVFPDNNHVLLLVRPDPEVSGDAALELGAKVARLARSERLGGTVEVAGLPLLAAALERETRNEVLRLVPVALVAMLALLLVVLRRRRGRFLALAMAVMATAIAVGLSWPLGLGLTVSTVAALPVMLGLALDFAVQLQARYWHERQAGLEPDDAAAEARATVGPTLALAAGAMSAGFLVLLVSSVPLLDRLGALLALGTLSGLLVALFLGPTLLVLADRGVVEPLRLSLPAQISRRSLSPRVLAVLVLYAVVGLAVSGEVGLQSDLRVLAPSGLAALEDVESLQRELGTSGQVSVAVRAADVTDPRVLAFMGQIGSRARAADDRLRPGPSLAELVSQTASSDRPPDRARVDRLLKLLPPYLLDAVVSKDRRVAELTFQIPFVPVAEQARIVERIDAALVDPPPGVRADTAGLVTSAAKSTEALDGTRPGLLLLAAFVVALILFAVWRSVERVALVVGPALLASGFAALVLAILDVRLSPLGAALEPLVLAVGLEFGMLLDMRFREARRDGLSPAAARKITTRDIGGAVALSAGTVAVGFAVLSASRLPLLSQLGWLVALELGVCLAVALLVVPAAAERLEGRRGLPRAERPRLRPLSLIPRRTAR